jgi:hydroxymethylbilane synthase
LKRLGKLIPDDCYLDTEKCLPAVSQGIIGIECRRDDEETIKLARSINDADSEIAVKAERGYMIEMEGDCKFPLAAYARVNGDSVVFDVMVGNPLSKQLIRMSDKAPASEAEGLGIALARKIKEEALKQGIINN